MELKITNTTFKHYHAVVSFVVNFCHFKKNIFEKKEFIFCYKFP
jgi:hypothetical protein